MTYNEFTTIQEVDNEFYNLFLADATPKNIFSGLSITAPVLEINNHKDETEDVLVRYAKRSGRLEIEEFPSYYPVISILNQTPVVDKNRSLFNQPFYIGGYDYDNATLKKAFFPAALNFDYQVSVAANTESAFSAIKTFMLNTFRYYNIDPCLILNKVETEEGDIGIVVPFSVEVNDITREDGRFECVYDFRLKTYVHLRLPETKDMIEKIAIRLGQGANANGEILIDEDNYDELGSIVLNL